MTDSQEIKLIKECQSGCEKSFGPLIQIYRKRLFTYLYKLSNNKAEAEDLFQETLIKVWRNIIKLKKYDKFSSWLFAIAHNIAIDNLNKKNRYPDKADELNRLTSESDPLSQIIRDETIGRIIRKIDTLPLKQKTVLLLRIYGELSFQDISMITKEPLNTVISHMNYSIKKLRKSFAKNE